MIGHVPSVFACTLFTMQPRNVVRVLLVYSWAMHKGGRLARKRRNRWIGIGVVMLIVGAAFLFFPRGLRGPETVARNFFDALLQAPDDPARLRAAAHIDENDDPDTLVDGLATRIALDFLRARMRQGANYDVSVAEARRPGVQRYTAVLRVTENAEGRLSPMRRFEVGLQKADNGDWRVSSVTVIE